MTQIELCFASAATAEVLVAGVPAAARAAREVALAARKARQPVTCLIVVAGGWAPDRWTRDELIRLTEGLAWRIVSQSAGAANTVILRGEALAPAETIGAAIASRRRPSPPLTSRTPAQTLADLKRAGDRLIAGTAKPGDGIVSRHINRPISQAISRTWLRVPGVTPFHATIGTIALGVAMAIALFFGGASGLIAGALLFQAASIFDGVDGEIARATFRTSASGAKLDSVTDAATNLAFIAGVTFNLGQQGYAHAAFAGTIGVAMLAIGLWLIGRRARSNPDSFTFDAIKHHFSARKSRLMQLLTWLTMRDFFALAAAVLILAGLGPQALMAFAVVTAGWLLVTISVLLRPAPGPMRRPSPAAARRNPTRA